MTTALLISPDAVTRAQLTQVSAEVDAVLVVSREITELNDRRVECHDLDLAQIRDQGRLCDLIRQRGPLLECHVFLEQSDEASASNKVEADVRQVQSDITGPLMALRACLAGMQTQSYGGIFLHVPNDPSVLSTAIAGFWQGWAQQQSQRLSASGFVNVTITTLP